MKTQEIMDKIDAIERPEWKSATLYNAYGQGFGVFLRTVGDSTVVIISCVNAEETTKFFARRDV